MDLSKGFSNEVIEARENTSDKTDDSIKYRVSVSPLKPGGASFKTNVLIKKSGSKYLYKPSIGSALFCFIFLAVGLSILFYGMFPLFKNNFDLTEVNWMLLVAGLIFGGAGATMFYTIYKPRVFDKQLGYYYKSYKTKIHRRDLAISKAYIPLKSIKAIQLIGEHIKSDDSSYNSFELNLVLDDASRKNVVDHGNLKSIIADAEILSDFLNIPIWHAGSLKD